MRRQDKKFRQLLIVGIAWALSACVPTAAPPQPTDLSPTITFTAVPSSTATRTVTPTPTGTNSSTVTETATATLSPTDTPSPTPAIERAYVVLRGVVNQAHVNCYYGPSKAYLYKYGLLGGSQLDIIGWQPDSGYLEVQAIGGNNPCWMNRDFMDIAGDIQNIKPVMPEEIRLPWSPYYPALAFAKAERSGDEVTISWSPLKLKAGDDSEQEPYLLEAWVCRSGKLTFTPVGAYKNQVRVVDEAGCGESSHARVYGVEKHGYTKYLKFDWPPAGE
jgi:hypothetical protein